MFACICLSVLQSCKIDKAIITQVFHWSISIIRRTGDVMESLTCCIVTRWGGLLGGCIGPWTLKTKNHQFLWPVIRHGLLYLLKCVFSSQLNTKQLDLPFVTCMSCRVTGDPITSLFFLVIDDCELCAFLDQFLLEGLQGWCLCPTLPCNDSVCLRLNIFFRRCQTVAKFLFLCNER